MWVYLAHGHVFATAQSGNVVLMMISIAGGDLTVAASHLPSLIAFVAGVLLSRISAGVLKREELNSRDIRLGMKCVLLAALAPRAALRPPLRGLRPEISVLDR